MKMKFGNLTYDEHLQYYEDWEIAPDLVKILIKWQCDTIS